MTSTRTPFSRSSSLSTAATLVPSEQQGQQQRIEEDVERELRFLALAGEDDEGVLDEWIGGFVGGGDGLIEEDEEFRFVVPEGL